MNLNYVSAGELVSTDELRLFHKMLDFKMSAGELVSTDELRLPTK